MFQDHAEELVHLQKSAGNELRQKEVEFQGLLQNMHKWKAEMSEKWAAKYQEQLSQQIEKYNCTEVRLSTDLVCFVFVLLFHM